MGFEYQSLCGNDIVLFSDFSSCDGIIGSGNDASRGDLEKEKLINTDESSEELDKLAFICSCAIESLQRGGSVLIPCGRVGMVLQLLEQISIFLESSNLEVPIFMVSTVAEEMLAYTNIIPEWLCKQRQENLYSGEALFSHVELIKRKKLQLFPAMHSIDLITSWQEPCIVFAPHWSLRLGPVVHLLRRWQADPNSLLVLEQEVDANLSLLPFKPLDMKVLQCTFLSGIKPQKIQPLLDILRPKLVLFPENPKLKPHTSDSSPYTILHYSEGETLRVPSLSNDFEVKLATDLAVQLRLVMMKEENLALARLKGKLVIDHGTFRFGSSTRQIPVQSTAVDPNQVLSALCEKGVNGTLIQKGGGICVIDVCEPGKGSIEIHEKHTVVSADDEILANLLFEVVSGILND
ncbi:non-specific serine/threonine protein kinase [Ranunculus cassubicifolius]